MKKTLQILFLGLLSGAVYSQNFIAPIKSFPIGRPCKVIVSDTQTIEGKAIGGSLVMGTIRTVNVKDDAGVKHKFKAEEIQEVWFKPGKLAQIEAASEAAGSVNTAGKTDFKELLNREWIIYRKALLPKAKDKYAMLQLINPGFDSKIQVFLDPNAGETQSFGPLGGEAKSYLVVKNNTKSEIIEKKKYAEQFPELFGDCPAIGKTYTDEKAKEFWNLPKHVYTYDQDCK